MPNACGAATLNLKATFELKGFLGYVQLARTAPDEVRPQVDHDLCFRAPDDATVIVPPALLPVGLLYWDEVRQRFWIETVLPDQRRFR